jgi:hypothetical protein
MIDFFCQKNKIFNKIPLVNNFPFKKTIYNLTTEQKYISIFKKNIKISRNNYPTQNYSQVSKNFIQPLYTNNLNQKILLFRCCVTRQVVTVARWAVGAKC